MLSAFRSAQVMFYLMNHRISLTLHDGVTRVMRPRKFIHEIWDKSSPFVRHLPIPSQQRSCNYLPGFEQHETYFLRGQLTMPISWPCTAQTLGTRAQDQIQEAQSYRTSQTSTEGSSIGSSNSPVVMARDVGRRTDGINCRIT
jgi:hypothetical protein